MHAISMFFEWPREYNSSCSVGYHYSLTVKLYRRLVGPEGRKKKEEEREGSKLPYEGWER